MNIKMHAWVRKSKQKGFTLLEIVIAISLIVILTTLLLTSFGPWMRFKQRLDTESKLRDLAQATTALYRANAFSIDDSDPTSGLLAGYGAARLNAVEVLQSNCPVMGGADPSEIDTTNILSNMLPLQPYASASVASLARDGFNNGVCVFVSPRQSRSVAGATLYYHSIAFVSVGENAALEPATAFVYDAASNVWTLNLDGDDRGVMIDGFQLANDNYKTTMERLQKLSKAYETYFNVRFLSKSDRDITIDYFYINDGTNNGDPGTLGEPIAPSIPSTRVTLAPSWTSASFDNVIDIVSGTTIGIALGVSASDGYDAWGRKLLIDNRSPRVRAGFTGAGVKSLPPYTAVIGALLPGTGTACAGDPNTVTNNCSTFISSTAIGTY